MRHTLFDSTSLDQNRAPLADVAMNQSAGGQSRSSKGQARRTRPNPTSGSTKHVQRVRASRSAGDIGATLSSIYASKQTTRPSSAKVFNDVFTAHAGKGAASKSRHPLSAYSQSTGQIRDSAPRERLAARRRNVQPGAGAKPASAGAARQTRQELGASQMVKAVKGLEPNSRQALLDAIRVEKEGRTLKQQLEEELQLMRQEAQV
jgi:hypothetical protein